MFRAISPRVRRYGAAAVSVAIALLLTLLLDTHSQANLSPSPLFFAAITFSAWYGGLGSGLLATILAVVANDYFFVAPLYTLWLASVADILQLVVFSLVALLISSLNAELLTAKQRTEASLSKLRVSYRRLMDTAYEGILVYDAKTRIEYVNQRMAQMLGYSVEEMRDRSVLDFMDNEVRLEAQQRLEQRQRGIKEQYDIRLCRKDGSDLWAIVCTSPIVNEKGEHTGAIAMLTDVTDRKRTEEALRTSEERYRELFENANDIVYTLDLAGNLTSLNKAGERIIGYSRDELLNQPIVELIVPEYLETMLQMFNRKVAGERLTTYELEILTKDKRHVTLEVSSRLIYQEGNPLGMQGIARDISDRKQAEQALRESESRLRRLVDSHLIGIIFADFQGNIIEANDEWLRILGYTRQEVLSKAVNYIDITPPEYRQLDRIAMEEMKRSGTHTPFEKEYIRKDGSRVPVLVGSAYIGGANDMGVGFMLDLTERKQAEESLRQLTNQAQEQANTLNAILSASVDNIYVLDCAGRYKYVSAGGAEALGLKPTDLVGKTWRDLGLPADIMQAFDSQRETVISTGEPVKTEVDFSTTSSARHYEYIVAPLYQAKSIEGVVVISRDATDRKQAEKAMRESEQRFRTLVEQSPLSTQILSPDGRTIQVNRAWEELWGLTLDQIPDYNMLEDEQLVVKGIMPYIKQGFAGEAAVIPAIMYDPNESIPDRTIHKEPHRWVSAFIYPVKDEDGNIREVVLIHEDITPRIRAEEALRFSEAKFRRLAQSNIIGVMTVDLRGSIIEANDAFLEMIGYTQEELIAGNINWRELTPAEHLPKDLLAVEQLHQTGVCTPFEKEYIRQDGSRVPILVGGAMLEGSQDKTICFVLDLSDRKQAEAALQETNQTLEALIQACPLAITVFNFDGKVKLWNPSAERIFGWSEQEAVGNFIPSVPEDKRDDFLANLDTISQGKELAGMEARRQKKDGSSIDVALWAALLHDAKGNINCMSIIADITERKQLEEERAQLLIREQAARAEAEAANRMKDEFLATLSHELRTPLNAMLGWTQLLRTRKFDEKTAARALETIDRNTKSLAQLIEDVLDVSRIITGKLRLNTRPIELGSVIQGAIETVQPAAEAKGIQIELAIASSEIKVLGDANRLQQVIWNLLSNAVKFTPQGGRVEVQLSTNSEFSINQQPPNQNSQVQNLNAGYAQIRVSDTGKGIPVNFLPYVFERFRQADSSITRSYGGLGLGLAIVRHLVELHGGTVYAYSDGEGQGATFTVQLPLLLVRKTDINGWEPESSGGVALPDIEAEDNVDFYSSVSLNGLRVLVVDDEADTRELLIAMLGEYGAEVTAVTSASEALEAIQLLKPDVLVSDIGMPQEDGYALIRKVRALDAEQGGQIPSVALTAYARAEDRTQALLAGFQLHVPKPVNAGELAAVLAKLTGR
jgi:PAS domain S-box-containing protein